MLRKLRKSSRRVTLVLVGVAALAGCGESRRNLYASREDCLADWGNKPQDCTPASDSQYRSRGYFYGPSYSSSWGGWTGHSGSTTHSIGSTSHVSRGGFGASGRSSAG